MTERPELKHLPTGGYTGCASWHALLVVSSSPACRPWVSET